MEHGQTLLAVDEKPQGQSSSIQATSASRTRQAGMLIRQLAPHRVADRAPA